MKQYPFQKKMYNKLIKYFYYPVLQKIKKENVIHYLKILEESQWHSFEKLKEMQWKRLLDLVEIASREVPYYRELFNARKIKVSDIRDYCNFLNIPLLSKEEVRNNSNNLVNPEYQEQAYKTRTSGSTGLSLEVIQSREFESWVSAGQWRARHWFGVDIGDRAVYLWGRPLASFSQECLGKVKSRLRNILLISAFELSENVLKKQWKRIKKFKPLYLYGYASSIYRLAEYVQKYEENRQLVCKAVFTTAETLFPYQRKIIESVFGCRVGQEYGCAEVGAFAYECPEGSLHIFPENVFLEVLKDGHPVPPGKVGEIVATSLNNIAMPLIRYRVGDLGIFLSKSCPCGRGLPLIDVRFAKITDMVITPEGKVFSSELFDYLNLELIKREIRGIKQFRIIQEVDQSLRIEIVKEEPFSGESIEFFKRKMNEFFGKEIRVDFLFVKEIEREKSGKLRYFISKVTEEQG